MGKKDDTAAALMAWNDQDKSDEELAAFIKSANSIKPKSNTIVSVQAAMKAQSSAEVGQAAFDAFRDEYLEEKKGDDLELWAAWRAEIDKVRAKQENGVALAAAKERPQNRFKEQGIKPVETPHYDGAPGGLAVWWKTMKSFSKDMGISDAETKILLRYKALSGTAASEFNRMREENPDEDMEDTMKKMMLVFDGGHVDDELRYYELMHQEPEENALEFYKRYRTSTDKLDAYGFPLDNANNVRRFTLKLRAWKRVREQDCKTLEEATSRAGLVEEGATEKKSEDAGNTEKDSDDVVLLSKERRKATCYNWENTGRCTFGRGCKFSHDPKNKGKNKQRQEEKHRGRGWSENDWSSSSDDEAAQQHKKRRTKNKAQGRAVF